MKTSFIKNKKMKIKSLYTIRIPCRGGFPGVLEIK